LSDLSLEVLSSVIGDVYDAVLEPDSWVGVLTRIAAELDAAYATIALSRVGDMHGLMAAHSPWDAEMLRILNEQYGVNGVPGLAQAVFGDNDTPVATLSMMSEATFQQSDFYRNWVRPQGLRDGCVTKFVHTADRIGLLGVITRADRDIISPAEQRFIGLLSPHLRRAALISDLLSFERVAARAYRDVLDGLSAGVVLTDDEGAIVYANPAAEAMFRAYAPVAKVNGRLAAGNLAMSSALSDAIGRATTGYEQALGARGIGIPVSAPGTSPAVAHVLPLSRNTARAAYHPAVAAVFISTTITVAPPAEATLATLFDLTPSEARVMRCIGSGMTTEAAALQLNVSTNTLKSHLNRVFSKTETNRQAELALLLARIAGPVLTSER
jgi:DNA-binding CsgD family transcriptional regulator/PAS domain-containing protein